MIKEMESHRWLEHFDALQRCFSALPYTASIEVGDWESDILEGLHARRHAHIRPIGTKSL